MPNRDLAHRAPTSALERVNVWNRMAREERRRRVAEAIRDGDRAALADFLTAFVQTRGRKGTRTSPATIEGYRHGLGTLLDWCAAEGRMVHQLTEDDTGSYRAALEDRYSSPRTVNTKLSGARRFWAALAWAGLVSAEDPWESLSSDDPTPAHERRQTYSPAELDALLAAADARARAMILLAADAGLRISEVARLRWEDVNLPELAVTVRQGKGGKTATLPIPERLAEALRTQEPSSAGPVFPDRRHTTTAGESVSRKLVHEVFVQTCDRAGVPRKGFHALRHAYGTRVARASGGNVFLTQRLMRHSDPRTSSGYVHALGSDLREVVDRLGERGAA